MTGTMREIIWIAGSLPVWIALELAETGLYIYLVTGILPERDQSGKGSASCVQNASRNAR